MLSSVARYVGRHHIGVIALLIALGGTAYAATKVGSKQIKRDAVKARHIQAGAVGSEEIAAGAVGQGKIAADAVGSEQVAAGGVSGDDLRCPAGLSLRAGLCFETTAQPPANWENALAACEARGLRLPAVAEAELAIATFPTPQVQENYWTSDFADIDSGSNPRSAFIANLPAGTLDVGTALQGSTQMYVCVAPAGAG
jgi:hypothetical protein